MNAVFQVVEDTFTPWAESKIGEMRYFQEQLLEELTTMFLGETQEFVPVFQGGTGGSLLESVTKLQKYFFFETVSEVELTWSGQFNTSDEEFQEYWNPEHDDYALSVYKGKTLYKHGEPQSDLWVEKGLEVFDSAEVECILKEQLVAWFIK